MATVGFFIVALVSYSKWFMGQAFHSKPLFGVTCYAYLRSHITPCLIGVKCALHLIITLNVLWWTFHMCICFMTYEGTPVSPTILSSVDLSCASNKTAAAEHDCKTAHYAANAAAHLTWTTGKLDCETDGLIGDIWLTDQSCCQFFQ